VLLSLGGCAETGATWQKAGTDAETLRSDLGGCQATAEQTYQRIAPAAPPVTLNPRLGADPSIRATDLRIRQQQMVDSCMREKGYRFEPPAER
jgi:hypothetical protein